MTDQGGIENTAFITPPAWWEPLLGGAGRAASTAMHGHAFLVTSEDGDEASLFTQFLAAKRLCQHSDGTGPCGECTSCRMFLQATHGDFLMVRRQEGKTAIGIEQIRDATRFVQQTTLYGDSKVLLIEAAEQMTLAAANSLLKTLEEPAGNTLILMASSGIWRLPATVRSRCQRIVLPQASPSEAVSWLAQQLGCNTDDAAGRLSYTRNLPIAAWTTSNATDLSLESQVSRSFDDISVQQAAPAVWSQLSSVGLLDRLLLWIEAQARRQLSNNERSDGASWLALHRCIAELSGRVKGGATPNQDILITEVYRLCRSRGHPAFDELATRFLSSLGISGHSG